ncbi:Cyclase family protein, partial [Prunus dulcis]
PQVRSRHAEFRRRGRARRVPVARPQHEERLTGQRVMMKFSVHSGTHVDAPGHVFDHFYDAGFDADTLDLEVLNGPALVVDVHRDKNITGMHGDDLLNSHIHCTNARTPEVMKALNIPKGTGMIVTSKDFRKLMWKKEFDTSYVGFMKDGAKWLAENTDIKLVGLDYLNVAAWDEGVPTHHVFLERREVILLEGLKLDGVPAGIYSVHCLPLRNR